MAQPVIIENSALKIEVWPQIGGKVSSLVDKADGFELLFNYPDELPTGPVYGTAYSKGWFAGWDELCPSIAPSIYPDHPYGGIAVPDHGELWGVPAIAAPTLNGITCVWNGLRFGYRLTRKLWLDGTSVFAEYTMSNVAPFSFAYLWAPNPLLSMEQPIDLGAIAGQSFRSTYDLGADDEPPTFTWPRFADTDLSVTGNLPQGRAWKLYGNDPIHSPLTVGYPTRERSLKIEYSSAAGPAAYWGIWLNTGGWAKQHHLSVAPTFGRFDQLDRAIRDHSAARLEPLQRHSWMVQLTVGAR